MFDLGWSEILLIVGAALIVIGPKDLPQAIRTVTQIIRKMRGMAREFQSGLDDLAREAGVDEIKKDLTDFQADYDPRAALDSIAGDDNEFPDSFDDLTGPDSPNSIEAPRPNQGDEPDDLTPADFGALDGEPPAEPAVDPAGGELPDSPPKPKSDGGTV